jgi:hypothetical protein
MSRLRAGELIAGVGAAGLFVLMFFNWFGVDADGLRRAESPTQPSGGSGIVNFFDASGPIHVSADGWSSLGWFMVVLVCVQILGGAALVYMTLRRASPAWPVGAGVLTWIFGSAIWLVLLVRVCVAQPGPDALIAVLTPAYLGLLFSALIPLGGLLSLKNERTRSPEAQAYMPPPARTAPGVQTQ